MKKLLTLASVVCVAALAAVVTAQTTRSIYYVGIAVYDEKGFVSDRVEIKTYALDEWEALSRAGVVVIDETGHEVVSKQLKALGVDEPRLIDYTCVGNKPCGAAY